MTLILLIAMAVVLVFTLGVLTGNALMTQAQEARHRRQAATQRRINDEWRLLNEQKEQPNDPEEED